MECGRGGRTIHSAASRAEEASKLETEHARTPNHNMAGKTVMEMTMTQKHAIPTHVQVINVF